MKKEVIGLNFADVLLLIFITLKLLGIINWSWWWVLSPIWIPLAIIVVLVIIYFIVTAIIDK